VAIEVGKSSEATKRSENGRQWRGTLHQRNGYRELCDLAHRLVFMELVVTSAVTRRCRRRVTSERDVHQESAVTTYDLSSLTSTVSYRETTSDVHPHEREGARRAVNVIVAALGLVLAAPIMALIAIAIKATSRGPVFFRQTRIGLDLRTSNGGNHRRRVDLGGRPFTLYKFRTMHVEQPGQAQQVWAAKNDPRVTSVGRFLRVTRLDELPQLWNVLLGHMNVVGPRPEQPVIFQNLRHEVSGYQLRQRVRPGITGKAQIELPYDSCVDDVRKKVAADLEYIERQSVVEDLRIMLFTAPAVLWRKGGW
jgi:lipopolysaccharide/colanic/teichoic acid biosynthesis glycosyltransferase